MNTKRNITALLLLAILPVILFTGCTSGSGITVGSVESNTSGKMSMTYSKFTGYREKTVSFKEENLPIDIDVSIETKSGKLDAYIAQDNFMEDAVFEGNDIPTMDFTVTISEPGSYTIRVDADNHAGGYSFEWDN